MHNRLFIRILLAVVFVAGWIPLGFTILPAPVQTRFQTISIIETGATETKDSSTLLIQIKTPDYFRSGITENIKADLSVKAAPEIAQNGKTELSIHLQVPILLVVPSGPVISNLIPGQKTSLVWDVYPKMKDNFDATLWIFSGDSRQSQALAAIPIEINAITFLGLPFDLAAFWGCALSVLTLVVWIILEILTRKRKSKIM